LIENVGEYIDPVLDPVLKKSFHFAQNGAKMIKLGDSEIEWDDNFRLYLTTKLPNPHYDSDATGKAQHYQLFSDASRVARSSF
jgi:dynein heavy chain